MFGMTRQQTFWALKVWAILCLLVTVIYLRRVNFFNRQPYGEGVSFIDFMRRGSGGEYNQFSGIKAIRSSFPIFEGNKFLFWNNDLHSSPIQDLKHFLSPMGVDFIHYAMDGRCRRYFNSECRAADDIKVINQSLIMDMDDQVISDFYAAYKDDAEMNSVDAFVCFHPAAVCELFMSFNRSIVVIASTRYAAGRPEEMRWHQWNWRLARLALSPRNVIAANNLYDIQYMKFYSGVEADLIPSFCGYTNASYHPAGYKYVLYAGRYPTTKHAMYFNTEWQLACVEQNCTGLEFNHFFDANGSPYTYDDIASYRGAIHIPYQISTMSFFEQYRMGVPVFVPSLDYLAKLDFEHDFVNERNCKDLRKCYADDKIAPIPRHPSTEDWPDPHNKTDINAIKFWLKFADFYQWPHVIYFDSVSDLIIKMKSTKYDEVSKKMQEYNHQVEELLLLKWKDILLRISAYH